eukprot:CAMPEP_0113561702 /NCGR_PEP_ID=MMETSP0015_2-20120614/20118_1 /TAXON_ID=2838 /ORGANISM="Odontella" /LENGTH=201 /DNA_ID=CAMNT_0000463517 /DNA_START=421 /DNA_END=1023 /DNA_ORIENTATION=- /assembly_acc=CAM_ASM_000160
MKWRRAKSLGGHRRRMSTGPGGVSVVGGSPKSVVGAIPAVLSQGSYRHKNLDSEVAAPFSNDSDDDDDISGLRPDEYRDRKSDMTGGLLEGGCRTGDMMRVFHVVADDDDEDAIKKGAAEKHKRASSGGGGDEQVGATLNLSASASSSSPSPVAPSHRKKLSSASFSSFGPNNKSQCDNDTHVTAASSGALTSAGGGSRGG